MLGLPATSKNPPASKFLPFVENEPPSLLNLLPSGLIDDPSDEGIDHGYPAEIGLVPTGAVRAH